MLKFLERFGRGRAESADGKADVLADDHDPLIAQTNDMADRIAALREDLPNVAEELARRQSMLIEFLGNGKPDANRYLQQSAVAGLEEALQHVEKTVERILGHDPDGKRITSQ